MWNRLRILFVLTGLLVCAGNLFAQPEEDTTLVFIKGDIYTKDGRFMEGKINLTSDYLMQYNIYFIDTVQQQSYYFSPKDLDYVSYTIDSNNYKLVSMENPGGDGMLMLREIYKGRYSLYQLVDQNHSQTVLSFTAFYFIYSDKWLKPGLTNINFVYDGIVLFSDCPELVRKIKSGIYQYSDLYKVIIEFNQCGIPDNFNYLMDPEY